MNDGTGKTRNGRRSREDRLAAQLRENLKRRKAQERARDATSGSRAEATAPGPETGEDALRED